MTLANMRVNGVRSLCVTCEVCHHEVAMNVDAFDDAMPVPAFGPRMVSPGAGSWAHSLGRIGRNSRRKRA